ncbi:hypothetical protein B0J13DRAFT_548939 [Dactylonectria estremocensis]|uniref:C2H2-type domain-containing protein n=1 Tax=Dactylonectria estremocensis TaxID=1079267 RepID=A0A9P9J4P1_9HYPO|nr:hypothetical protein B0J13DRAFT_548939 [Dactylonectria estremocensis]
MELSGHLDDPPQSQHMLMQPIPRYESFSDGLATDDSRGGEPSTRSPSPPVALSSQSSMMVTPRARSKFAVVLSASPRHRDGQGIRAKNEDTKALVISDLMPKGRPRALSTTQAPVIPQLGLSPTRQPHATGGLMSGGISRSRGRPNRWKPGMPYSTNGPKPQLSTAAGSREARLIKTRPSLNGFPKRRGRPPKAPSPLPREIYCRINTPFVAFLCEWRGCKAELHNLDTLRRHVYVVHENETRQTCQWGKCGRNETPQVFDQRGSFKRHMEEAHLVPFAWHVGDGPNNTSGLQAREKMEDEIPDYLKDENGNQVTPSIRHQQLEDRATWKINRRRLREILIRRDENAPKEGLDTAEVEE